MQQLGKLLKKKMRSKASAALDEKSVAFVFGRIVAAEYGRRGTENVKIEFFRDGKLHVSARTSAWASELWLSRQELKDMLNKELGTEDIKEVVIKR
ncbi:MAG TPA: DciA family protein [Candidatus Moranbacteria bacterium]|nr:DciA family protein [Candidatus Moranbacteria bacterium]